MLGVFALGMFCMLLIGYGIHLVLYPAGSCVSYPKRCCCRVVPSCSFVEQNRMAPYIPAEYAPYLKAGSKRIEGRLNPDMNVRVHRRYQPENYREQVIPSDKPVFGLTAGLPSTLYRLVGHNGVVFGLDHFGYSAPYQVLDEKFGFTAENVCAQVKALLKK